jgi:hypothetical protein
MRRFFIQAAIIVAVFFVGVMVTRVSANDEPDLTEIKALLRAQQAEIVSLRQAVENAVESIGIPEAPEPEVIYVRKEIPVVQEVEKVKEVEVPVLVEREIPVYIEIEVPYIVEVPVYIEPDPPAGEPDPEPEPDPLTPTKINYCLMPEENSGGTFEYSFSGHTLTATFYPVYLPDPNGPGLSDPNKPGMPKGGQPGGGGQPGQPGQGGGQPEPQSRPDPEPVIHTFDLSILWAGDGAGDDFEDFDPGDLPVNPIQHAWLDGQIIYIDLVDWYTGERPTPERIMIDIQEGAQGE